MSGVDDVEVLVRRLLTCQRYADVVAILSQADSSELTVLDCKLLDIVSEGWRRSHLKGEDPRILIETSLEVISLLR